MGLPTGVHMLQAHLERLKSETLTRQCTSTRRFGDFSCNQMEKKSAGWGPACSQADDWRALHYKRSRNMTRPSPSRPHM